MTTEQHSPADDAPEDVRGSETAENEPNEYGFSGDPALPESHEVAHLAEGEGERIAVPSGDLTGAITDAIEEASEGHGHQQ
ncbi:hypothetical protein ACPL_7780 [Actinoplanes sp. SE50/110]|uniref:hypothetical protein n=1 Tax=unclassified Actinoplanes TaxID=2626549 RepID=UPI00042F62C3|nr:MULTISPECIES: hypothetical protein [unclassified Actinoplanes]AEV88660.2 hypothetical protein ACPL_7780 [Actinoplanes sp. SE50/110]